MGSQAIRTNVSRPSDALRALIIQLAQQASVELNVQDAKHVA